jgi:hypothetical protein
MLHLLAMLSLAVFCAFVLPVLIAALRFRFGHRVTWHTADRSSAGLLPPASDPTTRVRILAARTVSWRGVVAHHCWIVIKPHNARTYTRYDYTAWGQPIRRNAFEPDGRWFGAPPSLVAAADAADAATMIPHIEAVVRDYQWRHIGDYRAFPGPNSNTFIAAIIDAVPGLHAVLPPTALGKDFPYDGRWLRRTATGVQLSWRGYLGVRIGWVEGFEINLLGAVAGIDWRRPAIKLPAIGRIGTPLVQPAAA